MPSLPSVPSIEIPRISFSPSPFIRKINISIDRHTRFDSHSIYLSRILTLSSENCKSLEYGLLNFYIHTFTRVITKNKILDKNFLPRRQIFSLFQFDHWNHEMTKEQRTKFPSTVIKWNLPKSSEFLFQAFHSIKIHPPRPIKITEAGQVASPRRSPMCTKRWFAFKRHRHDSVRDRATRDDPRGCGWTTSIEKPGKIVENPPFRGSWTCHGRSAYEKRARLRTMTTNCSATQTEKKRTSTRGPTRKEQQLACASTLRELNLFLIIYVQEYASRDYYRWYEDCLKISSCSRFEWYAFRIFRCESRSMRRGERSSTVSFIRGSKDRLMKLGTLLAKLLEWNSYLTRLASETSAQPPVTPISVLLAELCVVPIFSKLYKPSLFPIQSDQVQDRSIDTI